MTTAAVQKWPRSYAGFEALPFIHSILKGAADGVEGVGILTNCDWLPESIDGTDTWGNTWIEARANWLRDVAPLLLSQPRTQQRKAIALLVQSCKNNGSWSAVKTVMFPGSDGPLNKDDLEQICREEGEHA